MNVDSFVACCNRLVNELDNRGISLEQALLEPEKQLVENREENKSSEFDCSYLPTDLELTPFYKIMLDHFDSNVTNWVAALCKKEPKPDWQVVYVPLGDTAIDSDDWYVAAKNPVEALAFILQQLETETIKVTSANHTSAGQITINGVDGVLAQIQPIDFEDVSSANLKRARSGLKGLHKWGTPDEHQNKLKRIQGLESLISRHKGNPDHENRTCLHVTCTNICSVMTEALSRLTGTALKQSTIQELVAVFFGFESWNHFRGVEKQQSESLELPYYLAYYKPDSEEPPRLLNYCRGLPSALHLFGQKLLMETRQTFHIRVGMHFSACNLTENESGEIFKGDRYQPYLEDEGLLLQEMPRIYLGEELLEEAASLLTSQDFEKDLKRYLFNDCDLKERIIQLHERQGVKAEDHLFIKDWVFWVERERGSYGGFNGDRLSTIGTSSKTSVGSSLHKAAIVYREESNDFWLATDWDDKPKYCLEGLGKEDIDIIESTFINKDRLMSHPTRFGTRTYYPN